MDTVLKKFLSAPRHPGYLDKKEYEHLQERNIELYLSSAYFQDSDMYLKCQAYTANSLDDTRKYFICGLPYQLALKEGLLMKDAIIDEMSESTFSDITWLMEMEALFYGSGEDSLFTYSSLTKQRKLMDSLYPLEVYRSKNIKVPDVGKDNIRILSVDIALLGSKKRDNDASALIITDNTKVSEGNYITNVSYIETQEGLITSDLCLLIARMFNQYKCDYICVDGSGVGQPIVDEIMKEIYDPMYNVKYPAITCVNNDEIAERCKVKDAKKVLYVFKANATTNNDMCLALRAGIQNGMINFLISDAEAETYVRKNIKGYSRMTVADQTQYRLPYFQTSLMIEELAKLDHEIKGGKIAVKEKSGMRKDRYSSLLYNYACLNQVVLKLKPKRKDTNISALLPIHTPKRVMNI